MNLVLNIKLIALELFFYYGLTMSLILCVFIDFLVIVFIAFPIFFRVCCLYASSFM